MSHGVRLSSMRVDAFRGICDPIDFDFSSPITLVFAPNGTGKTTLCEAAEWLLTGQVERLRDGRDFDPLVLKSKFVLDGRRPRVDADIMVGDQRRSLFRSAEASTQYVSIAADDGVAAAIGPHDLLSFLAPAAASQEAHHVRAINLRQRWLRGTRFLTAEALAALVDSDDDTIERRTQVFADLLGIRHLLDAEKLCERFISELGTRERLLAQTIAGRQTEIDGLTAALATSPSTSSTHGASALTEIEAAERKLALDVEAPRDPSALASRIDTVTTEHGRRKHVIDIRRSSLDVVAAEWTTIVESEHKLAELEANEPPLIELLAMIQRDGQAVALQVTDAATRQAQQSERARALTGARDALVPQIIGLLGSIASAASKPLSQAATFAELMTALPESRWTRDEQARRDGELRSALQDLSNDEAERHRLDLLRTQLDQLSPDLNSEEAMAMLRSEAEQLDAVATAARGKLDAASDPLSRLQAAARDLFTHAHHGAASECPLCSHDWKSAEALRSAISATLDTVPELARLAQAAATAALDASRVAQTKLQEASRRNAHATELRRQVHALEGAIERRHQGLNRLGVSGADPVSALQAAQRRLAVAVALADLIQERERLALALAGTSTPVLGNDTALSGLLEHFGAMIAALDQVIQLQLSNTTKELEERTVERDRLRAVHSSTQQKLRACREELASLRPELDRLRTLWRQAAPNTEWSEDALAQARETLNLEAALLAEIAAHAAAARAAWSVEVRRARLEELSVTVAPQRLRLAHMNQRIAAAQRAKATFHETYNDVSKRQMEDLSRVVNPLFARMHANRVFDKVKLGNTAEPLRWLADAGSQEMDPGKDFSQGQRQDLALALFLGRARSLGGTFFLDEPVTHLDDLNRVGLLDIFRATVLESSQAVNLVITTASKALARHLVEKFSSVGPIDTPIGKKAPLRVIELDGNGRTGVTMTNAYPRMAEV